MRKLYYSNYIMLLTDGKKAAFYHSLNGNFIIFSDLDAHRLIDDIVRKPENDSKKHEETLEKLLEQGFLLKSFMTKEEEEKSYEDYYIVPNKTIFSTWAEDKLELSIPSAKKIERIKLNKNHGELWLKLSENSIKLKEVEDVFLTLKNLSNYSNSLFRLVSKEKLNAYHIFSNLYLSSFYKVELLKNQPNPSSLYLKLTDACNLNCKMCGQANNKKLGLIKNQNFLDLNLVKKFIEPIIQELEFINLWGGEPLLHPKVTEFIKYFSENKKYISIATNGTFLKKHAKTLVELGVDEIVVSIDGPTEIHNNIRGTNKAFEDAKAGIEEIIKLRGHMQIKPKIFINCTVTEENVDYLKELLMLCRDWKVNKLIYQLPMFITEKQGEEYSSICNNLWGITPTSWSGFSKTYDLDLDKLYDFYCEVKSDYGDFVDFYNINFHSKDKLRDYFNKPDECLGKSKCIVLNSALVIESNGDIVSCPDFPDIKLINIENTDYQNFFNSEIRKEFIQGFKDNKGYPICKRCCQFV